MMYPDMDRYGYGYCGCQDEPYFGWTGGYPFYRVGTNYALILVLFILLVIIGATRF